MTIAGPCVICGLTNYNLSMGGPTICPACDCGQFGPQQIQAQAAEITYLRTLLDTTVREREEYNGYHQLACMELERLRALNAEMLGALKSASGYMLNAKIDLETGAKKATAICTIDGGLKIVRAAIDAAEAAIIAAERGQ